MITNYQVKTLALAVITQAIQDYHRGSIVQSQSAKSFIDSPDLDFWADPLNVSAPVIRENLSYINGRLSKRSERGNLLVRSN